MNLLTVISLFLTLTFFAAIPGPGVLALSSRALSSGFRSAALLIPGMVTGDIIYMLFAVFGLSFAARAMGDFFVVIKFAGAAYIFILGIKIWMTKPHAEEQENTQKKISRKNTVITGFLISISNPKVIAFYCGFLPGFVDLSKLSPADIIIITCTILVAITSVLAAYAFAASNVKKHMFKRSNNGVLNRAAGGVMMAAGVSIAVKS